MVNKISLSYGKDSMCMLFKSVLDWGIKVERVVTVDMMFTDTVSADLPDLADFKRYADERILRELGLTVEHFRSPAITDSAACGKLIGKKNICGHMILTPKIRWCNKVKVKTLHRSNSESDFDLIGLAVGEERRIKLPIEHYPLILNGYTEQMCREWCENNGLLSPTYTRFNGSTRDGCFFCPCSKLAGKRFIFNNYQDYFQMVVDWQESMAREAERLNLEGRTTAKGKKYFVPDGNEAFLWKNLRRRFELENMQISIFEEEES